MARIDFDSIPWDTTTPGARAKVFARNGRRLRLVEFTTDFVEPGWCTSGHIGYVLEGELEITFADRTERFARGDGVFIPPGEQHGTIAGPEGMVTLSCQGPPDAKLYTGERDRSRDDAN